MGVKKSTTVIYPWFVFTYLHGWSVLIQNYQNLIYRLILRVQLHLGYWNTYSFSTTFISAMNNWSFDIAQQKARHSNVYSPTILGWRWATFDRQINHGHHGHHGPNIDHISLFKADRILLCQCPQLFIPIKPNTNNLIWRSGASLPH